MNSRKKYQQIAKLMYKNSLDKNGTVNNSAAQNIVKTVVSKKPQGLTAILKIYKNLIAQALSWEEANVETASPIAEKAKVQIKNLTGAERIKTRINPGIIFGAKITHGDWIYDATLDAELKRLTIND